MIRTGDREIRSVSGRLPDNPGELACMLMSRTKPMVTNVPSNTNNLCSAQRDMNGDSCCF